MKASAVALCVGTLLLLSGYARASIPECPEDQPFGECESGNPCADPAACGDGKWCQRGCGCAFKCIDNGIVTVAALPAMHTILADDDDAAAADATAAAAKEAAEPAGAAAAAAAAAAAPAGKRGLFPALGPISLPGKPALPNITALAVGVHESLAGAVQDALAHAARVKALKCPDGKPVVGCAESSCDAKPCGKSQVCVPQCGSCSEHKCLDVELPFKLPDLPELPHLQLPKLPKMSFPKPPCGNNEAMNLVATLKTIPATLLMSQNKHLSISCSPCPNGTVSKQPALTCTLCLPGTYADRSLSVCRQCNRGYYAKLPAATECLPCPANTFAPLMGSFACIPCPPGFNTGGKKAQSGCAFDASYKHIFHLG